MSENPDPQTAFAVRGANLKSTFDAAVAGIFADYIVDLTPVEESTGGGVRARQHIRLTAKDGRSLVVGAANSAERTAEVRTLGCTLEVSQQRFGAELPIPGPEYARFIERAIDVLQVCGLEVKTVSTTKASPSEFPRPR